MPEGLDNGPGNGSNSEKERLQFDPEMTTSQAIEKLADGNPGAAMVLSELSSIDPMLLFDVDSAHLYGEEIHNVFKDTCDSSLNKFQEYLKSKRQLSSDIKKLEDGDTE